MGKRYYTVKEVAELTGRTPPTIYRWVNMGLLKAAKIHEEGTKGALLIAEEDLVEFYRKNLTCRETFELEKKIELKEILQKAAQLPDHKAGKLLKLLTVVIFNCKNSY